MATSDSSLLEETQKELQMMKTRYSELHQAFKKFKAQCKCGGSEVLSDPFLLDDPCVMKILSFLKPKELLESMEICHLWKQYIESSKLLMNRIYDGVILSINLGKIKVVPDELRHYKHMSLKFPVTSGSLTSEMQESNANLLLNRYALSLDTLRLSHEGFADILQPMNYLPSSFPMLRKLRIQSFMLPFQMLEKSSFPALEVLHIKIERMEAWPMDISRFRRFLGNFPKLKHLMIEFDGIVSYFLNDTGDVSSLPLITDKSQPQLETIAFPSSNYPPFTLRNQQNSLTKLSMFEMNIKDLSYCLRDLKNLRCLSIFCLYHGGHDGEFILIPENDSIEVLKIHFCLLKADKLSQVIFKLPSLKDLAVRDNDDQIDIRFIASNMRHFQRLFANGDDQQYSSVYREIQLNANQYINTSFVILNALVNENDYKSFEELELK